MAKESGSSRVANMAMLAIALIFTSFCLVSILRQTDTCGESPLPVICSIAHRLLSSYGRSATPNSETSPTNPVPILPDM